MSEQPPTESPVTDTVEGRHVNSLLLVHTGDGKGKSTAAFGTALRALSRGWKVVVVQFLKSGDWRVGEEEMLTRLGAEWFALGDGFTWDSENMDESEALARRAWDEARGRIQSGEYGLVVLDEVTYPMTWGWIDTAEVVDVLTGRPDGTTVIATGRDAPSELVDAADTVTSMTKVKHAFDAGILAKRGIDY